MDQTRDLDEEEQIFDSAVIYVNSAMKKSTVKVEADVSLKLYAFYKQAMNGPCNTSKPSMFDFVGRHKWDAWNKLGNMDKKEAMKQYVETVNKLNPSWETTEVTDDAPGSSSSSSDPNSKNAAGPVFSHPAFSEGGDESGEKDICYWTSEGDEKQVQKLLNAQTVNWRDGEGRTPLMWACDRGHLSLVNILLKAGADHSLSDNEKMTPLHYAAMCGYSDIVTALVKAGADKSAKDEEGSTPLDVADPSVSALLAE